MGRANFFIGMVYQDQQKYDLAIEYYLKALPVFEEEKCILDKGVLNIINKRK